MIFIIDNNFNYKFLLFRQSENIVVSFISMFVLNLTEFILLLDISNGFSRMTFFLDGYFKFIEILLDVDNQCVFCLDFEEELVFRIKYYFDFIIDRQRKINNMLFFFFYGNEFFKDSDNSDNACEELFIREVEGCEVKDLFVFRVVFFGVFNVNDFRMIVYLRFSFYLLGIDSLFVFFRFGYRISRFSRFSVSNRFLFLLFSRKSIINLQVLFIMIEDLFFQLFYSSGSSRYKLFIFNFQVLFIMIEDFFFSKGSSRCFSNEDFVSVYIWFIYDIFEEVNLEDSYFRNIGYKVVVRLIRFSRSSSVSSIIFRKLIKRDRDFNRIQYVFIEFDL